jgi:zinc transporter ZupT
VNLCTLIGVITAFPASLLRRTISQGQLGILRHIVIPSFACGALTATSTFLLIPESIHMLSGGHEGEHAHNDDRRRLENSEADVAWKFGISVLGGYFIPFVLSGVFPHGPSIDDREMDPVNNADSTTTPVAPVGTPIGEDHVEKGHDGKSKDSDELDSKTKTVEVDSPTNPHGPSIDDREMDPVNNADSTTTPVAPVGTPIGEDHVEKGHDGKSKDSDELDSKTKTVEVDSPTNIIPDYRLMTSILVGDFFHNFSDGIFIGTSFLVCSQSFAIAVALSTVFHELCQELADYLMLTNQCGLAPWKALVLNFLSGISVMLGVIVIMAMDVSNESIGVLLAISSGVYFNIAFTDCAPRTNRHITDTLRRVISLLFWILGAVPIGLVLLNHEHCE